MSTDWTRYTDRRFPDECLASLLVGDGPKCGLCPALAAKRKEFLPLGLPVEPRARSVSYLHKHVDKLSFTEVIELLTAQDAYEAEQDEPNTVATPGRDRHFPDKHLAENLACYGRWPDNLHPRLREEYRDVLLAGEVAILAYVKTLPLAVVIADLKTHDEHIAALNREARQKQETEAAAAALAKQQAEAERREVRRLDAIRAAEARREAERVERGAELHRLRLRYPHPYNSPEYLARRAELLADDPLCDVCKIAPANVVHHGPGGKWDNSPENTTPVCKACNTRFALKFEGAGNHSPAHQSKMVAAKEVKFVREFIAKHEIDMDELREALQVPGRQWRMEPRGGKHSRWAALYLTTAKPTVTMRPEKVLLGPYRLDGKPRPRGTTLIPGTPEFITDRLNRFSAWDEVLQLQEISSQPSQANDDATT